MEKSILKKVIWFFKRIQAISTIAMYLNWKLYLLLKKVLPRFQVKNAKNYEILGWIVIMSIVSYSYIDGLQLENNYT